MLFSTLPECPAEAAILYLTHRIAFLSWEYAIDIVVVVCTAQCVFPVRWSVGWSQAHYGIELKCVAVVQDVSDITGCWLDGELEEVSVRFVLVRSVASLASSMEAEV